MEKENNKTPPDTIEGIVEEVLPNTLFRVTLDDGDTIIAYLAGKLSIHRIRVIVGDRVVLVPNPYGGRARIIRRL